MLEALRAVPLPHVLIAASALGVPGLMWEMGYNHWRGNFHRWPMLLPVAIPPLFVAAAFLFLGHPVAWTARVFAAAALLLVLMGFGGAFFHHQGIARQTGGYNFDNVMVGPPQLAPLAFSGLGALGLLGLAYGGI